MKDFSVSLKSITGFAPLENVIINFKDREAIEYKSDNMVVEFKNRRNVIGQATLKSHNTYNEVLKVTSGENRTVIWYSCFFTDID